MHLAHHLFPDRGVRGGIGDVSLVEHQVRGLDALVMARHAVFLDYHTACLAVALREGGSRCASLQAQANRDRQPTHPKSQMFHALLPENPCDDVRFLDTGQLDVESLIPVREPIVVDAELMKYCRLKIAY